MPVRLMGFPGAMGFCRSRRGQLSFRTATARRVHTAAICPPYAHDVPGQTDRLWVGSMPQAYDRWLAPAVFRPFAIDLARRAAQLRPGRVLELAAGTGVLTRELIAACPAAAVTATDLNAAMVAYGSGRVPGARWQQADALGLPFGAGEFDLIACQFGVMFFPDRPAAFREASRVLTPAGRLLFSTWDAVGTHAFAAALMAGLERFP